MKILLISLILLTCMGCKVTIEKKYNYDKIPMSHSYEYAKGQ